MEEVTSETMDRGALSPGEILEITAILAGKVPGGMNEKNAAWQRLFDRAMSDEHTLRALEAVSALMNHRFRQDFMLSRPALAERCSMNDEWRPILIRHSGQWVAGEAFCLECMRWYRQVKRADDGLTPIFPCGHGMVNTSATRVYQEGEEDRRHE